MDSNPFPMRWLVIDTDAGVDDAVALALAIKLAASYHACLKLVTTSHGNTDEKLVFQNVHKTIYSSLSSVSPPSSSIVAVDPATASTIDTTVTPDGFTSVLMTTQSIKVARGAKGPLNGSIPIDAQYFHGYDGLGDVSTDVLSFPEEFWNEQLSVNSSEGAVSAIIALCVEAKAVGVEVVFVTLGPLTNLALTIQQMQQVSAYFLRE